MGWGKSKKLKFDQKAMKYLVLKVRFENCLRIIDFLRVFNLVPNLIFEQIVLVKTCERNDKLA